MELSDVIAIATAVVSAVIAIVAIMYSRRAWKIAVASVAEAKRSADAAEAVAEIEQARRTDELAEAVRRQVRFRLKPNDGRTFLLINDGDGVAYDVAVDLGGLLREGPQADDQQTHFDQFPEGHEHEYWKGPTVWNLPQEEAIKITWHHQADRSDAPTSTTLRVP